MFKSALHLLCLTLTFSGCVTMGQIRPYTADELAVLDEYQRAAEKIISRMQPGLKGKQLADAVPNVRVADNYTMWTMKHPVAYIQPSRGLINARFPATIYVNRAVLAHPRKARAVLAHELAHYIKGHTHAQACVGRAAACEDEANITAPALLHEGWGITWWPDSVAHIYAYLIGTARMPVPANGHPVGHEDSCGHVRVFAAHYKLTVIQECK
jgi:hypothetical protein